MLDIALSFIIGISRPVRKFCQGFLLAVMPQRILPVVSPHHETIGDVAHRPLICVFFIRLLDHKRIYNGCEPIHKLVEIHAGRRLACLWSPVVLGKLEALVKFGEDEARHALERVRDSGFK